MMSIKTRNFTKSKILLATAILVLCSLASVIIFVSSKNIVKKVDKSETQIEKDDQDNLNNLVEHYEGLVQKTEDIIAKSDLYISLSKQILSSEKDNNQALRYALEADKLNPTADSAYNVKLVYEKINDVNKVNEWAQIVDARSVE